MIDIIGILIVVTLVTIGHAFTIAAAIVWLAIGIGSVMRSRSRGLVADILFVFGAPIYWVVEG